MVPSSVGDARYQAVRKSSPGAVQHLANLAGLPRAVALEMLRQPGLLENGVRQIAVFEVAFIGDREVALADRTIPSLMATLAEPDGVAAGLLEERN